MLNSATSIYARLGEPVPAGSFPTESFAACRDTVIGKQLIHNDRLSPEFDTLAEAMEIRARLIEQYPDAGICKTVRYF